MNPAFKVKFFDAKSGIRCSGEITHAPDSNTALMQVIHRIFKTKSPRFVKNNGGLIIWRILNKKDNSNFSVRPMTYDSYKKVYVPENFREFFAKMT